jgi:hypothetical protein
MNNMIILRLLLNLLNILSIIQSHFIMIFLINQLTELLIAIIVN